MATDQTGVGESAAGRGVGEQSWISAGRSGEQLACCVPLHGYVPVPVNTQKIVIVQSASGRCVAGGDPSSTGLRLHRGSATIRPEPAVTPRSSRQKCCGGNAGRAGT